MRFAQFIETKVSPSHSRRDSKYNFKITWGCARLCLVNRLELFHLLVCDFPFSLVRGGNRYTQFFAMSFPISLFIAVVDDVCKCHDQVNTFDVKELAILSLLTASTTFRVLKSVKKNPRIRQLTKPSTGMCFDDRYKNGKLNSRKLSFLNITFYSFCALIISVLWFYCLTLCNANKKNLLLFLRAIAKKTQR